MEEIEAKYLAFPSETNIGEGVIPCDDAKEEALELRDRRVDLSVALDQRGLLRDYKVSFF